MSDSLQLVYLENEKLPPEGFDCPPLEATESIEVFQLADEKAVLVVKKGVENIVIKRAWLSAPRDESLAEQLVAAIQSRHAHLDKGLYVIVDATQPAVRESLPKESMTDFAMEKPIPSHYSHNHISFRQMESGKEYNDWISKTTEELAAANPSKTSDPEAAFERAKATMNQVLPQGQASQGHFFEVLLDDQQNRVGAIWFYVDKEANQSFCYNVVIEPELRGTGQGHRILALWEKLSAEQKVDKLALHVFNSNSAAVALYLSYGFQVTSTVFKLSL